MLCGYLLLSHSKSCHFRLKPFLEESITYFVSPIRCGFVYTAHVPLMPNQFSRFLVVFSFFHTYSPTYTTSHHQFDINARI